MAEVMDDPGDDLGIEKLIRGRGFRFIAGVDEAGRGPLAGPVTAAAVILPPGLVLPGLRDSKLCTPKQREELYRRVRAAAIDWAVAEASPEEIDRLNIRRATFLAMSRALSLLRQEINFVLVDGWEIPGIPWPQTGLVHGESKSQAIAAASILAKVTRDRFMIELERRFPGYGFARHKGYGTREHRAAIKNLGPLPVHRKTFAGVREYCGGS